MTDKKSILYRIVNELERYYQIDEDKCTSGICGLHKNNSETIREARQAIESLTEVR